MSEVRTAGLVVRLLGPIHRRLGQLSFRRSLAWGSLAGFAVGLVSLELGLPGLVGVMALAGVALVVGWRAESVWVEETTTVADVVPDEPPDLFEMVSVDGGTFLMGSPWYERERFANERRHKVTVSAFRIGETAVTRAQYEEVMGIDKAPGPGGPDHPVTNVSWWEAARFCNRASEVMGYEPCYVLDGKTVKWRGGNGYRLPTEAEWEYAARAGTRTRWSFGNRAAKLGNYAWYQGNSGVHSHPVGTKAPNRWGLFDMHGNVWEWCWDVYAEYPRQATQDPRGPGGDPSAFRVVRGGSFRVVPWWLRSALRNWFKPVNRNENLGFRCIRGPRPQP